MVQLVTGDDLYRGEGETVIEALNDARVVDISRSTRGTVILTERCDEYFSAELTAAQIRALCGELMALVAGQP